MDLLAEANRTTSGRWVLVPRKGERFMGPRDRKRARIRRRRRVLFTFLLEATALAFLIGLFPPLRAMLAGAAVLAVLLVLYVGLLLHLRVQDLRVARIQRARLSTDRFERVSVDSLRRFTGPSETAPAHASGNGHSNGNGHAHGAVRDRPAYSNGNGNGHGNGPGSILQIEDDEELDIVEEDVHVVVRRGADVDTGHLGRLAR